MKFGEMLEWLPHGVRMRRKGWDGKGMWIAYSPGYKSLSAENFWAAPNQEHARANGGSADVGACITMKAVDGVIEMGWRPTSRDMFADDWECVPEDEN